MYLVGPPWPTGYGYQFFAVPCASRTTRLDAVSAISQLRFRICGPALRSAEDAVIGLLSVLLASLRWFYSDLSIISFIILFVALRFACACAIATIAFLAFFISVSISYRSLGRSRSSVDLYGLRSAYFSSFCSQPGVDRRRSTSIRDRLTGRSLFCIAASRRLLHIPGGLFCLGWCDYFISVFRFAVICEYG